MKKYFITVLIIVGYLQCVTAQQKNSSNDTLFVYGPGGPYPAMQEAATNFSKLNDVEVIVKKGPLNKWKNEALKNADIIYSGSEFMMTNFEKTFETIIDKSTIYPLYLRKSGILVRKNNPKDIRSLQDLSQENLNIMVVQGAGLTGVWEDMIGGTRDLKFIRKFRKNIVIYADNSGVAKQKWIKDDSIDIWISWNIWQISNSDAADFVATDPKYTLYRDCGISLTHNGVKNEMATKFYEYLKSEEVTAIFNKWGWE